METRTVSIIIPTLNRTEAVCELVRDVLKQQFETFDITVVDQTDALNQTLHSIAQTDQRLKIIRTDIRGTCHARNLGIAATTGEIIIFFDDDCRIADQDLLSKHVENYDDPAVGGVAGRVHDQNIILNRAQRGPVCRVTATGVIYGNANSDTRQDVNAPRGAHMSFRRTAAIQAGPFDVHFRGNAMREETDFSLRVVAAGWRIVYDPTTDVLHLGLTGGSRSANRLQWYRDFFFNESYFFLKHFPRRYLVLLLWRKARAIGACWLYYGHGKLAWFLAPWRAYTEAVATLQSRP